MKGSLLRPYRIARGMRGFDHGVPRHIPEPWRSHLRGGSRRRLPSAVSQFLFRSRRAWGWGWGWGLRLARSLKAFPTTRRQRMSTGTNDSASSRVYCDTSSSRRPSFDSPSSADASPKRDRPSKARLIKSSRTSTANYEHPEDLVIAANDEDPSLRFYLGTQVVIGWFNPDVELDLAGSQVRDAEGWSEHRPQRSRRQHLLSQARRRRMRRGSNRYA